MTVALDAYSNNSLDSGTSITATATASAGCLALAIVHVFPDPGALTGPTGAGWTQIVDKNTSVGGRLVVAAKIKSGAGLVAGDFSWTGASEAAHELLMLFTGFTAYTYQDGQFTFVNSIASGTSYDEQLLAGGYDTYDLELLFAWSIWNNNANGGGTGLTSIGFPAALTEVGTEDQNDSSAQGTQQWHQAAFRTDGLDVDETVSWAWNTPSTDWPNVGVIRLIFNGVVAVKDQWAWTDGKNQDAWAHVQE